MARHLKEVAEEAGGSVAQNMRQSRGLEDARGNFHCDWRHKNSEHDERNERDACQGADPERPRCFHCRAVEAVAFAHGLRRQIWLHWAESWAGEALPEITLRKFIRSCHG